MSLSPFTSTLYRDLFIEVEIARLFSDTAEIRAMMIVEGALAKAQAELAIIPSEAGEAINRAMLEIQIDPGALAAETGQNGVPVPALISALRAEMNAPDHAAYLHFGATSQDIMDTALVLRLRQALILIEARLNACLDHLARQAEAHADLAMVMRSYGQHAAPGSFGARIASWGWPLLRHRDRLNELRPRLLRVSLSGAAGTSAALGPHAPALRAALAQSLDLGDPQGSWHSSRDTMAELAGWLSGLTASLGKMGEDLILQCQGGIKEITLPTSGSSSTMPQKQNPVHPSVMVALARHGVALNSAMAGAVLHREERDGAAWFTEWLALPSLVMCAGKSVQLAEALAAGIEPDAAAMARNLDDPLGLSDAEAISFALSEHLPRPEAVKEIKRLCAEAVATGSPLPTLVLASYPECNLDMINDPMHRLGQAPDEARAFAMAVRAE